MSKGLLLVISGFSGAGKGTVMKRLLELHDEYSLSISATTRKPREGEADGREYFFKTVEEFEKMIAEDALIEHAQYVGNYYGTPKAYVEEQLDKGNNVILEIEIQGAMNIKRMFPDAVLMFITPPSAAELEKRLRGRGTEDEATIKARLSRAAEEAEGVEDYDKHVYVGDTVVLRLYGEEFAGLHEVIRKRVIYKAVHALTQTAKDIYKVHVNAVDELIRKQVGSSADICYGLCAVKGYEDITISRKNVASRIQVSSDLIHVLTPQELKRLNSGENITIEENIYYNNDGKTELRKVHIVISLHSNYEKNRNYANSCYAKSFDYDKIQGKLCIRHRTDGDRIVVNRAGTWRKLKKEFIDRKVPADMRDNVLVVSDDSGVLWAVGVRRSECALIDDETRNVLDITIQ